MKKIFILVFIICNLFSISFFAQKKDTITIAYISVYNYDIPPSSIEKYPVLEKSDFEGSYHFGDSEGESNLDILYSNDNFFARTEYGVWEEGNSLVGISERLNIKTEEDKIIIENTKYELAKHDSVKGLKSIYFEETGDKIKQLIQFNPDNEIEKPKGKYPETSFVKLTQLELMQYSKSDLKIIRNEIFARNGYVFKRGGEMDQYFSTKAWYVSTKKTNQLNLSDIEKHNINLIRKIESQKNLNKSRIRTLELLSMLPSESMGSWNWSVADRIEYAKQCTKVGYLINDNSGMMQKSFKDDNHLLVQVVDGVWEFLVIPVREHRFFILTNDLVGGGNNFDAYSVYKNEISKLDTNIFPDKWEDNFKPIGNDCELPCSPFLFDFLIKGETIFVKSWEDECLLKKELTFKFNQEKFQYEIQN